MPTRPALKMGITLPAFNSLDFISSNKKPLISDDELKEGYLTKMRKDGYNPTIAFDDRQRVVDMFRSKGLTVFQVAEGDF